MTWQVEAKFLHLIYKMTFLISVKQNENWKTRDSTAIVTKEITFICSKINKFYKMSEKVFSHTSGNFILFLNQNSWMTRLTLFHIHVFVINFKVVLVFSISITKIWKRKHTGVRNLQKIENVVIFCYYGQEKILCEIAVHVSIKI